MSNVKLYPCHLLFDICYLTSDIPPMTAIDPRLLEILVCPLTKATLRYDSEKQELISDKAGLAYPIRDGIPIMLAGEAREINRE